MSPFEVRHCRRPCAGSLACALPSRYGVALPLSQDGDMRRIGMAVLGLALGTTPLVGQRSALREVRDRGSFGVNVVVAQPLGAFRRTGSVAPGLSGFAVVGGPTLGLRIDGSWMVYDSRYQGYGVSSTSQIGSLAIGPQITLGQGPIRLYGFATAGGSLFWSNASYSGGCGCYAAAAVAGVAPEQGATCGRKAVQANRALAQRDLRADRQRTDLRRTGDAVALIPRVIDHPAPVNSQAQRRTPDDREPAQPRRYASSAPERPERLRHNTVDAEAAAVADFSQGGPLADERSRPKREAEHCHADPSHIAVL